MKEDNKRTCYDAPNGFYIIGKNYKKNVKDEVIYRIDHYCNIKDNYIYENFVLVLDENDQSMMGIHEYMYMDQNNYVEEAKINYSKFCLYCECLDNHSVKLHNSFLPQIKGE